MSKEPVRSNNEPVQREDEYKSARERAQHISEEERLEIDRRQRTEPDYLEKTKPEDPSARPGQLTRDNVNPNIPSGPKDRPLLPDGRVDPNAGGIVDPNTLGMESQAGAAPPAVKTTEGEIEGSKYSINEPPGSDVTPEVPGGPPPGGGEGDAPPIIEGLDPDEAEVGGEDVILHVHGTGFTDQSVIVFNGGDEATSFVNDTELTTGVKPSLVGDAVVVPVKVRNGTVESDEMEFEFLESAPVGREATRKRTKTSKRRR